METTRLKEFLSKYKEGTLNEAETLLLMEMLADGQNESAVQDDIAATLKSGVPPVAWKEEWTAPVLAYIKEHGDEGLKASPGKIARLPFRRWWKYAAAIIVVVSATTLMYVERIGQSGDDSVVNIIEPGSHKALLTLADGSIIVLDQQGVGQLAQQGRINVVKLDSSSVSYQGTNSEETGFNTLTTPRGGQFNVVLPDGTTVWLNSASSITYPISFKGGLREVSLTGEAYFEVKENKVQPFIVNAGALKVQVLGTGFNIMAYADEGNVQTALVHGSVKVNSGNDQVILKPGEQAGLVKEKPGLRITEPDMEQVLAWKNGDFNFDGADIRKIMRQVSRWYDVDVVYEGKVSDKEFTGIIPRRENVRQVLDALEMPGVVHFSIEGRKIRVIEGAKKQ